MSSDGMYANRHIPAFLSLFQDDDRDRPAIGGGGGACQVVKDGTELSAKTLREGKIDISRPILVTDVPESIGMVVLKPSTEGKPITVRQIAEVIGLPHLPVRVMDVEHQMELKGWTLRDLVDYFEDEDRLRYQSRNNSKRHDNENKKRRKAAEKATTFLQELALKPRVLNQISMEFSKTALAHKFKSPQFVREMDWINNHWPRERKNEMPSVQYYCLTSARGCYTDFHVDFGGSSVYYHVLSGAKQFLLIKPSPQNLTIYEEWLGHPDQESVFLPEKIPNPQDVITVHLATSQTLFIPTGWIHAVYTPTDAVVLGGNFLHGFDMPIQLEINEIELRTKVPMRFKFPYFERLHFYTAGAFLRNRSQGWAEGELAGMPDLINALEKWYGEAQAAANASTDQQQQQQRGRDVMEAAIFSARLNGYSTVKDFLSALRKGYGMAKHGGNKDRPNSNNKTKKGLTIKLALTSSPRGPSAVGALGSPKSPRIRLSLNSVDRGSNIVKPEKSNDDEEGKEKEDETFRIVVSSVAKETHEPLPQVKRNPRTERLREDIDYVDVGNADDDEWVPDEEVTTTSGRRRPGNNSTTTVSLDKKRKGNGSPPVAAGKTTARTFHNSIHGGTTQSRASAPATKKPKTTARQRLLKKFR